MLVLEVGVGRSVCGPGGGGDGAMEDGELLRVARGVDGKDDLRRTKFMGMCARGEFSRALR